MKFSKYRVIEDDSLGFEVQIKRWWFPWLQCWDGGPTNTFNDMEGALEFIEEHKERFKFKKRKVYWEE